MHSNYDRIATLVSQVTKLAADKIHGRIVERISIRYRGTRDQVSESLWKFFGTLGRGR